MQSTRCAVLGRLLLASAARTSYARRAARLGLGPVRPLSGSRAVLQSACLVQKLPRACRAGPLASWFFRWHVLLPWLAWTARPNRRLAAAANIPCAQSDP